MSPDRHFNLIDGFKLDSVTKIVCDMLVVGNCSSNLMFIKKRSRAEITVKNFDGKTIEMNGIKTMC